MTRAPRLKGQRPAVVWFTGLSGAGKSTIANLVEQQAPRARPAHVPARRRQRPARAQQGPRLHRGRPGREHPPGRRGRRAHGRCRADRAGVVHLAVPLRAPDGARAARPKASSSRCSSTPRSRSPSHATARASTPRPGAASSRLHRHRLALRSSRRARAPPRCHRRHVPRRHAPTWSSTTSAGSDPHPTVTAGPRPASGRHDRQSTPVMRRDLNIGHDLVLPRGAPGRRATSRRCSKPPWKPATRGSKAPIRGAAGSSAWFPPPSTSSPSRAGSLDQARRWADRGFACCTVCSARGSRTMTSRPVSSRRCSMPASPPQIPLYVETHRATAHPGHLAHPPAGRAVSRAAVQRRLLPLVHRPRPADG